MGRTRQLPAGDDSATVDELKKQLEELNKKLLQVIAVQNKENTDESGDDDFDNVKIGSDEYIKVMSLYSSLLNLTTQPFGKGKVFSFNGFGVVKRIVYHELVDIMDNHYNFLEKGYFVILDKRVVRKHGLDDIYTNILSKANIDKIILGENQTDAVNLFKSANEKQQDVICRLLIDKRVSGEEIDLNLLDRLSREVGYNIYERSEEILALKNLDNDAK
jgi:hypothetical protein